MMPENKVHTPLADGQIRLLSFNDDSGLTCTLSPYNLQDAPKYVALSYTWGRANYQKGRHSILYYAIELNDSEFEIQQNLHDALGHLAKDVRSYNLLIWIDAICINQDDLAEKTSQIMLMRSIYEGSNRVYTWLGIPFEEEETRLAVKLMKDCNQYLYHKQHVEMMDINDISAGLDASHEFFPMGDDDVAWLGVATMLRQRYWQRVWVYQEATTPGRIVFWCGIHQFNDVQLSAITYFSHCFSQFKGFPAIFARYIAHGSAGQVSAARYRRVSSGAQSLEQLLSYMRIFCCSEDKDRVFAPLALAQDVSPGVLKIDYHQTLDDIYSKVATHLLLTPGLAGLETLSHVYIAAPDSSHELHKETFHPSMPSWVPDWRSGVTWRGFARPVLHQSQIEHLYNPYPGSQQELYVRGKVLEIKALINREVQILRLTKIWDEPPSDLTTPLSWIEELTSDMKTDPELIATICNCMVGDAHAVDGSHISVARGSHLNHQLLTQLSSKVASKTEVPYLVREGLLERLRQVSNVRRAAMLTGNLVAIVPAAAQLGDRFAAFAGGHLLYLIRPRTEVPGTFSFIGECYVHSMMDGGFVRMCEQAGSMSSMIRLI